MFTSIFMASRTSMFSPFLTTVPFPAKIFTTRPAMGATTGHGCPCWCLCCWPCAAADRWWECSSVAAAYSGTGMVKWWCSLPSHTCTWLRAPCLLVAAKKVCKKSHNVSTDSGMNYICFHRPQRKGSTRREEKRRLIDENLLKLREAHGDRILVHVHSQVVAASWQLFAGDCHRLHLLPLPMHTSLLYATNLQKNSQATISSLFFYKFIPKEKKFTNTMGER